MQNEEFARVISDCGCGMVHTCPIQAVYIGREGAVKAAEMLKGLGRVLVVSDGNTRPLYGGQLFVALESAGIAWNELHFAQTEVVVPDEAAIARLEGALAGAEALVGIGSGVISDLCKYVSFRHELPYMIMATAPSMDGYASVGAALILEGMKVTKNAHVPRWIVADVEVLKNAPMTMIRAGIGDILGKYSCLNDWKLAAAITGEHFCGWVYDRVMAEIRTCIDSIAGCMAREADAVGRLMNSLVQVGVAMSYMGNSRPASGSEHHLSHFFEITGLLGRKAYLPHGIDVGYSAILTARLREMLAAASPDRFAPRYDASAWRKAVGAVYGTLAGEVEALQAKNGFYAQDRCPVIMERWETVRQILKEAPTGREMTELMQRAGYEMEDFVDFYGDAHIRRGIRYAKDLKDRYTLLWVLHDVGLLEEFSHSITLSPGWKGFRRPLLVAGHRGVRHTLPENTLTAFRRAIAEGADMIETDVRMTKDGVLVLMHDADVARTTDGTGLVREMTLAQFKALNAAHDFEACGFEAAPTLREFLETLRREAPRMLVNFELKEYPAEGREAFAYEAADKTLAMIEEFGLAKRCVINSFSGKLLEYIHTRYGGRYRLHGYYPFDIMGDMTLPPREVLYCACMMPQRRKDGAWIGRCESVCPQSWFDFVKSQGIIPWVGAGLHSAEELGRSLAYGAELVTTDYPAQTLREAAYLQAQREKQARAGGIRLVALDLDGTLTQHKSPLEEKNLEVLKRLQKKYKLLIVGAGSCQRIFRQMGGFPIDIIGSYGMEFAEYDKETQAQIIRWQERHIPDRPANLRRAQALRQRYELFPYAGETLEFHTCGMLTFPILGTQAPLADKLAYDPQRLKRREMLADAREIFSGYHVMIGGSSSFDIVPQAYGKLNALRRYMQTYGFTDKEVVYCGDDYLPGGNDSDIMAAGIPFIQVDCYTDLEKCVTDYGLL